MTSNHDVKISKDLEGDIRNEHVLIVEDIIDTGYTLEKSAQHFKFTRSCKLGDLYLIR